MNKNDRKLKDRQRKALKRSQMSEEEKQKERKACRERNAAMRTNRTEQEKEKAKEIDRDRKAKKSRKSKVVIDYVKHEKAYNRLYKQRIRTGRSEAEHEYEIIYNLLCMRKIRSSRNGKEHLLDNLDAKKGMQLLKNEGRLKPFHERSFREIKEIDIWRRFMRRGKEYSSILKIKKPKTAEMLEEQFEKEWKAYEAKLEHERPLREKGYLEMNLVDGQVWWTGKEPPTEDDINPYEDVPVNDGWQGESELTDKEWEDLQYSWYLESVKERRNEDRERRNKIARENYHKRKEGLSEPISMPEVEMSEYEKIRESIIKERNEALEAAVLSWTD